MAQNTQFAKTSPRRWVSLNALDSSESYILQECRNMDGSQKKLVELGLCIVAVVFIICAYLRFLLPQSIFGVDAVPSPLVFSMAAVGVGLALYAFGTRGYQPEFGVDKRQGQIWVCKLNSQGRARVKSVFPQDDIKSVFVSRPADKSEDASLYLRLNGQTRPIYLVRGQLGEIEAAHGVLCEVLRNAKASSIVKPVIRTQASRVGMVHRAYS